MLDTASYCRAEALLLQQLVLIPLHCFSHHLSALRYIKYTKDALSLINVCSWTCRLDLMAKIQQGSRSPTEEGAGRPQRRTQRTGSEGSGGIMRDSNIELLSVMLETLSKEHDILYQSLLTPITTFVMELLPDQHRETTKNELAFEDLYVMAVSHSEVFLRLAV